jgi:VIT1/CCC1 family predicted Fe2+/Mn2+ transporter
VLAASSTRLLAVSIVSLLCLTGRGSVAALVGGASATRGAGRVAFWGTLAMASTAGVGMLFGTQVD